MYVLLAIPPVTLSPLPSTTTSQTTILKISRKEPMNYGKTDIKYFKRNTFRNNQVEKASITKPICKRCGTPVKLNPYTNRPYEFCRYCFRKINTPTGVQMSGVGSQKSLTASPDAI